jgi:hypothetical protein
MGGYTGTILYELGAPGPDWNIRIGLVFIRVAELSSYNLS